MFVVISGFLGEDWLRFRFGVVYGPDLGFGHHSGLEVLLGFGRGGHSGFCSLVEVKF